MTGKMTKNEKILQWVFVALVFAIMLVWVLIPRKFSGPDEPMRYKVVQYLVEHPGKLPHGTDEAVRDEIWGISYAFFPILSYMVSAVFAAIAGCFTDNWVFILKAARMADVLFITLMAYVVIRIACRLFEGEKRWLFSAMVIFLPEVLFMGTYVNTDSLALLASAVILLAWVRYLDEGWTWKNCMLLAVGMGVCLLSYYNAYGWVLWSFFFFVATCLLCSSAPVKERWKFMMSRGMGIAGVTLGIAGWWFVRNMIIYDGDILARKACNACGEKYALDAYKPSVHPTPASSGWNILNLFIYQDPGWPHNWISMVLVSFIGTFGFFHIFMNETVSKIYLLFLGIGFAGMLLTLRSFYWKKQEVKVVLAGEGKSMVRIKTIRTRREWSKKGMFHLAMLAGMITPVVLLIEYAFYSDNQAQGRYILSAVFPIMYFTVMGYDCLLKRFVKKEKLHKWFYIAAAGAWVLGAVLNLLLIIVPAYTK